MFKREKTLRPPPPQPQVHEEMMADWGHSFDGVIPEMLAGGVRAMIYAGTEDFIWWVAEIRIALLCKFYVFCNQLSGILVGAYVLQQPCWQQAVGGRASVGRLLNLGCR